MPLPQSKTPPSDKLTDKTTLIYGPTKIGKSTFCSQAPQALFLATEPGLKSLNTYEVSIGSWDEMLVACKEIASGGHQFSPIVIDTADNAFKFCADHVCGKQGVTHQADLPYGKGHALVNNEFQRVLNKLAALPYGLILVSHSMEKEIDSSTGKYNRTVPTMPEGARKIILGMADMVLFCDIEMVDAPDGSKMPRRVIRTKPNKYYEAGDRTGRLPETIDLDFAKFSEAFKGNGAVPVPIPKHQPAIRI